jgi:hypothetical protein
VEKNDYGLMGGSFCRERDDVVTSYNDHAKGSLDFHIDIPSRGYSELKIPFLLTLNSSHSLRMTLRCLSKARKVPTSIRPSVRVTLTL